MHCSENSVSQQIIQATRIILPCTLVLLTMDLWPFFTEPLSRGQTIGRDAYSFWSAGMLAFEGRTSEIYNNEAFSLAIKQLLGPEAGHHSFPYPPPALLGAFAFGWLPYKVTLFILSIAGFFAFLFTINFPDFKKNIVWLTILMPLTWCNIVLGQNGLLTAALFIGGLRLANHRPIIAGILIGCLAYKPTMAILIPMALLFERRWIVIFSATVTLLSLCIITTLMWGTEIWTIYLQHAIPFQRMFLEHGTGIGQTMKLTPFMSAHLLGYDTTSSYLLQLLFTIVTIGTVIIYFLKKKRSGSFNALDITILAIATILIVPYNHFYDLAIITGSLLLLAAENTFTPKNMLLKSRIFVLLYILPILGFLLNALLLPISPVILLIGLLMLYFTGSRAHAWGPNTDVSTKQENSPLRRGGA